MPVKLEPDVSGNRDRTGQIIELPVLNAATR